MIDLAIISKAPPLGVNKYIAKYLMCTLLMVAINGER